MTTYANMYFEDNKGTLTAAGEHAVATGLAVLLDAVTANNYEKGWRIDPEKLDRGAPLPAPRNVGELIALLHSEVTEAFEAHRNNEPKLWFEYEVPGPNGETLKNKPTDGFSDQPSFGGALGKPQGIASELADVIIRILDMAQELDIPLITAVIDKHRYNQTRPYRHGNKAC